MRGNSAAILGAGLGGLCRTIAIRQLLGIMTAFGVVAALRPAPVAAQAIGTMQVEARVIGAESEWSSLQTAERIAIQLSASNPGFAAELRVALPLSEIQRVSPSITAAGERRPTLISVQYLRN
ncbi:MAG TPA: hypothetical protein VH763_17145 [Gemmatimonadales bacterium]